MSINRNQDFNSSDFDNDQMNIEEIFSDNVVQNIETNISQEIQNDQNLGEITDNNGVQTASLNEQSNLGNFNQTPNVMMNNGKEIKKTKFKYVAINQQQMKVSGYLDAYNRDEVVRYLQNENYQIIKVEPQNSFLTMEIGGGSKLKHSDLSFILTQLSTYLKAGIPLIDSIKILEKQSVKKDQRRIFSNITYELIKGESFSNALAAQGKVFPELLVNMVKTSELTGDLPEILDDMAEYYTTIDRTRKAAISAMTYPTIIFIFSIMVITFILIYIIPQFESMFTQNNATVPGITTFVLNTSHFITSNALYIIIGIILFILIYSLSFKHIKGFRKFMQSLFMRIPVVGNIIIYKEVAMFTKTFSSLLAHNVFITDSMKILSTVSTNEVYKDIIKESLDYLAKGAKISDSFKGKWAFPIVAYEMLVTGENTGRLALMMDYVAKYYEDLHANMIKRLNTFIEPLMIVFLALIVGTVVLSVIIPMFSFYSQIT